MPVFGLIGKSLSHSFSKSYFDNKFGELGLRDHTYRNFELSDIAALPDLVKKTADLRGLNVTIPYKETVLPFLDEIDAEAKQIGAVNCIAVRDGRLFGYNTDAYGFAQSIKPFLDRNHERALILGTGGGSRAVAYGLGKLGIVVLHVTSQD